MVESEGIEAIALVQKVTDQLAPWGPSMVSVSVADAVKHLDCGWDAQRRPWLLPSSEMKEVVEALVVQPELQCVQPPAE